jgi:hypothetical protein
MAMQESPVAKKKADVDAASLLTVENKEEDFNSF